MNTQTLRNIGTIFTAVGTGAQLFGVGMTVVAAIGENRANKAEMKRFRLEEEKKHTQEVNQHELDILEAKRMTEEAKAEKISRMNQTEFMEMKAKEDAKASERVVAEAAEKVHASELLAEDRVAKANSECESRLAQMRAAVRNSERERDDAVQRYEHINAVFTNRERIQYQIGKINDELAKMRNDPFGMWQMQGGRRSDGSTYESRIGDRLRKIENMMKEV